MEQRLQKVLAAAGIGSRRRSEALIVTGRVAVDGRVVTELGTKVDPDKAIITVDGKVIGAAEEKRYILLNKPVGYTSTRSDPHAVHTVMELVRDVGVMVYPVGRLDVDTSGLLILTNDGDLANLLTHPSHEIEKTYRAIVQGRISSHSLSALGKGVELEDGLTAPASARLISYSAKDDRSTVEIIIHEGRKRQVRRMFAAVGHRVEKLARVQLGNLTLVGLCEGETRRLTKREVALLVRLAQPASGGSCAHGKQES